MFHFFQLNEFEHNGYEKKNIVHGHRLLRKMSKNTTEIFVQDAGYVQYLYNRKLLNLQLLIVSVVSIVLNCLEIDFYILC